MIQCVHATISTCIPRRLRLYTIFMCILTSSGALHKHENDLFASVARYTPLRQLLIQSYYFAHKHEINIEEKSALGSCFLSIFRFLASHTRSHFVIFRAFFWSISWFRHGMSYHRKVKKAFYLYLRWKSKKSVCWKSNWFSRFAFLSFYLLLVHYLRRMNYGVFFPCCCWCYFYCLSRNSVFSNLTCEMNHTSKSDMPKLLCCR